MRRSAKDVAAVDDDISFDMHPGELLGLPGTNSAGKTPTVKMLARRLIPPAGFARTLGFDVAHQAERIRPGTGFIFAG